MSVSLLLSRSLPATKGSICRLYNNPMFLVEARPLPERPPGSFRHLRNAREFGHGLVFFCTPHKAFDTGCVRHCHYHWTLHIGAYLPCWFCIFHSSCSSFFFVVIGYELWRGFLNHSRKCLCHETPCKLQLWHIIHGHTLKITHWDSISATVKKWLLCNETISLEMSAGSLKIVWFWKYQKDCWHSN